jgi:hypothetical protein
MRIFATAPDLTLLPDGSWPASPGAIDGDRHKDVRSRTSEKTGAPFAEPGLVIVPIEYELVHARLDRLLSLPLDALALQELSDGRRPVPARVEAVAAKAPAIGHQHAVGTCRGDLNLGRDCVGAVQQGRRPPSPGGQVSDPLRMDVAVRSGA